MLLGTRLFVFFVFAILAVAFLLETGVLLWEFRDAEGLAFATHDSHTFLFFPTLGLLALAAFYTPACVLTDMYWRYVRFGRLRLAVGFVVLAGCAWMVAQGLNASPFRSVWDLKPAVLLADKSVPNDCGGIDNRCERLAMLDAIKNVSTVSHARLGLSDFGRSCKPDRFFQRAPSPELKRFCFASTPLTENPQLSTNQECCQAQARLQQTITTLYGDVQNRSLTHFVHALVLPLKVFFLLLLGVISVLLALRHRSIRLHYPADTVRVEVGVIVGAFAMIFFPLMSQAFVQTADALYGTAQNAGFKPIVPFMSFAFGAWALLLLLFFYRRYDREVEMATKVAGVIVSAVAIVKYDLIIAILNRLLGSGAGMTSIILLVVLTVLGIVALLMPLLFGSKSDDAPV